MKTKTLTKKNARKTPSKKMPLRGPSAHLIGALRGKLRVTGDIMSTGRTWHAES